MGGQSAETCTGQSCWPGGCCLWAVLVVLVAGLANILRPKAVSSGPTAGAGASFAADAAEAYAARFAQAYLSYDQSSRGTRASAGSHQLVFSVSVNVLPKVIVMVAALLLFFVKVKVPVEVVVPLRIVREDGDTVPFDVPNEIGASVVAL